MELLLLKLVAFARPLASMELGAAFFEIAGISLFALLIVALLVRMALTTELRLSGVDLLILAFSVWCVTASIVYIDSVRLGELAKLLLPLLGYIVVKNVVSNEREYRGMMLWMIVGFAGPALASAILIASGHTAAIDMVNYWTKVTRWDGVYIHSHVLGHSMTLLLMAITVWVILDRRARREGSHGTSIGGQLCLGVIGIAALYCLYMSQVRSAALGLLTFFAIYLFHTNRRILIIGASMFVVVAVLSVPYWLPRMAPELFFSEGETTALDIGSGRPRLWLNDINVFLRLPIDQQLAGAGVGASEGVGDGDVLLGHNDWLQLLTQTGIVGFALFFAIQVAIFRRVRTLQGTERHLFFALLIAVNVMMLVSNSYVWRIQVSQLYYMILAFIEIPRQGVYTELAAIRREGVRA